MWIYNPQIKVQERVMTIFAERLKQVMEEYHISQSDLSRMTGIGRSRICQYLSGKFEPRVSSLKAIADALGVQMEYLLGNIPQYEETLSVPVAANLLNIRPQQLREQLKSRKVPFGYAVLRNGKYQYFISPKKFEEFLKTKGKHENEKV